jgi:pyridoxamine-phosphate oxidase
MDVVFSETPSGELKVLPHNQYKAAERLSPATVDPSPLDQFHQWFREAAEQKVNEPEVMSLSTATPSGIPSARMVLFKQLDHKGFRFFTNYNSRKSQELESNPHAALVFYWKEVHRSVRIVGKVEKISREESEEYFSTRPVGSRLGAWASEQSKPVAEGELDTRLKQFTEKFGVTMDDQTATVPLPDFWGGWRVVPL